MKCLLPVLINQYNNQIFATGGERLTQTLLAEKQVSPLALSADI